jgi:hypothetical protein
MTQPEPKVRLDDVWIGVEGDGAGGPDAATPLLSAVERAIQESVGGGHPEQAHRAVHDAVSSAVRGGGTR